MRVGRRTLRRFVFKTLEVLPTALGDSCYHGIQNVFGGASVPRLLERHRKILWFLADRLRKNGVTFQDKRVLEIGSGWAPTTAYILKFELGCREVETHDIAAHFSRARVSQLNRIFFEACSDSSEIEFLAPYLLAGGVRYRPRSDLKRAGAIGINPDLVYSHDVMEHVEPETLIGIHRELRQRMGSDGRVLHVIAPCDHRADDDPNLSLYDFLQYTEEEWSRRHTRFDYHNRLRLPEYRQLFARAGFEVEWETYTSALDSERLRKHFRRVSLDARFRDFTEEENTAKRLVFLLRPA